MTCLAYNVPPFVTTAAPTAIGASDMASFWMVGPPLRDSAAATPPPMIPSEFAGLTTASTFIVVMSVLARWICMAEAGEALKPPPTLTPLQRAMQNAHFTRHISDRVGEDELCSSEPIAGGQGP